ncbi:MAG: hypothetical protein V4757_13945 [Pseudomonadota bacterium]
MTNSHSKSFLAAMTLCLCLFETAHGQSPISTNVVEVPAGIRDRIAEILPKAEPANALRRIRGVVESGDAKPVAERYFERLDNGLWGTTLVITVRGAIIRRALTLQGMIPLATVTEIAREFDASSVVPLGKNFFSYSVTRDLKANGSTNITALSGELAQLVAPASGTKFSFEHAWEAQSVVTTSGLFGGTRVSNVSLGLKQACAVENERDASTLHANFRGKFLPVSCEGKLSNGSTRIDQYAFVVDGGMYILLSTTTDGRLEKYTISDVEYVK